MIRYIHGVTTVSIQYSILDDLLLLAEQVSVCVARLGSTVKLSVKPTGSATMERSAQFYTVCQCVTGRFGGIYKGDMGGISQKSEYI